MIVTRGSVETAQLGSLAEIKQSRDDDAVNRALERLGREASNSTVNLMPALIEAARAHVTVGESMNALEAVFGTWYERTVV